MTIVLTPFDLLDTNEALLKLVAAINEGGSSLTLTDGSSTVADVAKITVTGGTVGGATPNATLDISGSGGPNTILLLADTDIAAGTSVSINSLGHAVQTWGPAPVVDSTVTLMSNAGVLAGSNSGSPGIFTLSATQFVAFVAQGSVVNGAVAFSLAGETFSVGDINTDSSLQNMQAVSPLDGTHFVYAYVDGSSNLQVRAASISANAITLGSAVEVSAGGTLAGDQRLSFAALSPSLFVMSYADNTGQNWLVAGSLSGTTITLGTPVDGGLAGSSSSQLYPIEMTSTSFVAVWQSDGVNAVYGSVSGTTITLGTLANFASATAADTFLAVKFDGTHFCILFATIVNGTAQTFAAAGVLSGSTITFGTAILVHPSWYQVPSFAAALSTTQAALYSSNLAPTVITLSGSTTLNAVIGAPLPVQAVPGLLYQPNNSSLSPFGTSNVFPAFVAVGSNFMFEDGLWNIYEGTPESVISSSIAHPGIALYAFAPISSTQVLAILIDFADNMLARVITYEPINNGPIAFAPSGVSEGDVGTFTNTGIATGFSDLTPGLTYFSNGDGTVIPVNTGGIGTLAGVALTESTILLQRGRP